MSEFQLTLSSKSILHNIFNHLLDAELVKEVDEYINEGYSLPAKSPLNLKEAMFQDALTKYLLDLNFLFTINSNRLRADLKEAIIREIKFLNKRYAPIYLLKDIEESLKFTTTFSFDSHGENRKVREIRDKPLARPTEKALIEYLRFLTYHVERWEYELNMFVAKNKSELEEWKSNPKYFDFDIGMILPKKNREVFF